jgi:hypothetical protein
MRTNHTTTVPILALALLVTTGGCKQETYDPADTASDAATDDQTGQARPAADAPAAGALVGEIQLLPGLDIDPSRYACVFLVARQDDAGGGSALVKKIDEPAFPLRFELSTADGAHSDEGLAGSYRITARLDQDGYTGTQPGDVEGVSMQSAAPGGPPVLIVLKDVATGGGDPHAALGTAGDPHAGAGGADPHAGLPGFEGGAMAAGAAESEAKFPPGEGPRIKGTLDLDPAFSELNGRHTLFVMVRSQTGAGMPICVVRVERAEFPMDFDIGAEHAPLGADDTYQILEGTNKLVARLSVSGSLTGGPGDVEAEPLLVEGDGPAVTLTLSQRREQ